MINVLDLHDSVVRISGDIIATDVSYDDFIAGYDEMHVEWVNGAVIQMPAIDEKHDAFAAFLRMFFDGFLELTTGGRVLGDPVLMKLENVPSSRTPDLQVLLPERLHQLRRNQVIGPANLVVEVVSQGSRRTDTVDKLREYELGGVPEYWVLDHIRNSGKFYQLNDEGAYEDVEPDENGLYHSKALPGLAIDVSLFRRQKLPGLRETLQILEALLLEK
ncbi:MAG: Uma2 family endonuclease [Chloroflexota bacterium]|nr:Uma2 family endonuclease [Chloroflexota bacterium]